MRNNLSKYLSLAICLALILSILAIVKAQISTDSTKITVNKNNLMEKCSKEIEGLKLCTNSPKIIHNSGEPIIIRFSWVSSLETERFISVGSSYDVSVVDEKGKKLTPGYEQQVKNEGLTKENMRKLFFGRGRSSKGVFLKPGGTYPTGIKLTELYDYDLSAKGKYYVRIEKSVPNITGDKNIEFVLDNIEIQIK